MERQSTKHGPRLDEELKRETQSLERGAPVEAHVEEEQEHEPAADGEPEPSARPAPPGALGPDERTARTELSRHLRPSVFPAARESLIDEAAENDAPELVLAALRRLPAGVTFATVYDVWESLGGSVETVTGREEPPRSDNA
jgi:uncharacterized protein DUF2795